MRVYLFQIGFIFLLIGCRTVKQNHISLNLDYLRAADSIKTVLIESGCDYIYFHRKISQQFNRNVYLVSKNAGVNMLHKINESGIYVYNSPYWYNVAFGELNQSFKNLENDSIGQSNVTFHHAPYFVLECRLEENTIRKEGAYYDLNPIQPLSKFIHILESDLLNAEQDFFYWMKK